MCRQKVCDVVDHLLPPGALVYDVGVSRDVSGARGAVGEAFTQVAQQGLPDERDFFFGHRWPMHRAQPHAWNGLTQTGVGETTLASTAVGFTTELTRGFSKKLSGSIPRAS